jgi:CDGSH-type Zn-finger protein
MKATLLAVKNGPLALKSDDNNNILFQNGKPLRTGTPSYLCRCGASKDKPFCDGMHQHIAFRDTREISKELIQEYEGKEIHITFNRSICAGSAHCVQHLPDVFSPKDSTNWIYPDNANKSAIISTIHSCPSGALSYAINDEHYIDTRTQPKVTIIKNGPYAVEAVSFKSHPVPTHFAATKYTLCRCGLSKNKPYCDYSHAEQGWRDDEDTIA